MTQDVIQLAIPGVPAELKQKLQALAEADRRSLSAYVRILLEKHVQAFEAFEVAEKKARKSEKAAA